MAFIIFLIWLLLNAHFAFDIQFLQIVLFGLGLTAVLYFFIIKFTRWTLKFDIFFLKHIHLFFLYIVVLFYNILISNFNVLFLIVKPRAVPHPEIISFEVDIKDEMLRTLLANSITLTPGTITISMNKDRYIVHCLRKEYFEGFENSTMVKILKRMEAK